MRGLRRFLTGLPIVALAACVTAQPAPTPVRATPAAAAAPAPLPPFPHLGSALPAGNTFIDNRDLAHLFAVMSQEMEGGARRPYLTRYEGPISVGLEGKGAARYGAFLDRFLAMMRQHTGIRITHGGPRPVNLHVRFVPGAQFDSTLPTALCVMAEGDVPWEEFARHPLKSTAAALARVSRIDQMTVFIPDNALPYMGRNCLLEEVPQALGLSNDLYGLGMSSFNDDDAHIWPTKLDYLMLRLLYSPGMHTGESRRETESLALEILNRINPQGLHAPPLPKLRRSSLQRWTQLIDQVFSRDSTESSRMRDIGKALVLIEAKAPESSQHCFTLVTAGRVLSRAAPARSLVMLDAATRVCDAAHGASDIRHARIGLEAACALERLGRYNEVVAKAENLWPVLAAHGQDEKLAALYTMESEALTALKPGSPQAASVRQLAAQWNAYAVGPGRRAAHCRPRK